MTLDKPRSAKDVVTGTTKFLMCGHGGAGKTMLSATLPGKTFLYVFDVLALETVKGLPIDYEDFLPDELPMDAQPLAEKSQDIPTAPGAEPVAYLQWEEHFQEALKSGFFEKYDNVGFDGFTAFQQLMMDRILFLNGRYGRWPTEGDYTPVINTFTNVWRQVIVKSTEQDFRVFATAHIKQAKNKMGRVFDQLVVYGELRERLPSMFSDIYLCEADVDASNERKWFVRTAADADHPYLRSSLHNLDVEEEVTIPLATLKSGKNLDKFGLGKLIAKQ